jgi:hypothetical protein
MRAVCHRPDHDATEFLGTRRQAPARQARPVQNLYSGAASGASRQIGSSTQTGRTVRGRAKAEVDLRDRPPVSPGLGCRLAAGHAYDSAVPAAVDPVGGMSGKSIELRDGLSYGGGDWPTWQ